MVNGKSALIIANSHYQDPDLRQLIAPAYDAEALAHVLANPAIGGFEVKTLLDKPAREVSEEIEKFFLNRRRGDLLLLYLSGHGIKDDDGLLYFATPDTHLIEHGRPLRSSAVSAEFVKDVMRCSKSRRQVLMLDCCYSGAFAGALMAKGDKSVGIKERFAEGRGMVVITASDALQYSFEGEKVEGQGQRSVFTRTMVEGIESGKADLNHDGEISLDELYEYVYEHVSDQTPEQRPRKWDLDIEGKIFLAHSPTLTPADLPPELLEAIANPLARVRLGAIEELGALLRGSHKGLALAARQALISLKDDDSRRIATAAEDLLSRPVLTPVSVLLPVTEPSQPVAAAPAKAFDVKPVSGQKVLPEVEVSPLELPQPASAQPIRVEPEEAKAAPPLPKEPAAEQVTATQAQPQISGIRSFWKSWNALVLLGIVVVLLLAIFIPRRPATKAGPESTPTPIASSSPTPVPLIEEHQASTQKDSGLMIPTPSSATSTEGGIIGPPVATLSDPKNRAQIKDKNLPADVTLLGIPASSMDYSQGLKYLNGDGVPRDYVKARQFFEKAAAAGNPGAMLNLGKLYESGLGVPQKDDSKAREWYEKAATAGNRNAMVFLGIIYEDGQGVPRNYRKSREWYEKAAAAGSTDAMGALGTMYEKGIGVARDYQRARQWYEKAAALGDCGPMLWLGDIYRDGKGVLQNYRIARQWYEKAAAAGAVDAKTRLQRLPKE